MASILLLSGSPAASSRSAALLEHARQRFIAAGLTAHFAGLRDFPAEDLVLGKYDSPAFEPLKQRLAESAAVVIGTPIYKASLTGGLKALLDILPQTALRGKIVLPVATGGSPAHQLAIDFAIKPILAALGATDQHQGVYVTDKQLNVGANGQLAFADEELRVRFEEAISRLVAQVKSSALQTV